MTTIKRGDKVTVRTATGEELVWRAMSGVEQEGHDFPVVWVTTEDEWESANGGEPPEAWPWPAEDVAPVKESAAA